MTNPAETSPVLTALTTLASGLVPIIAILIKNQAKTAKQWQEHMELQVTFMKKELIGLDSKLKIMEEHIDKKIINDGQSTRKSLSDVERMQTQFESLLENVSEKLRSIDVGTLQQVDDLRVKMLERKVDTIVKILSKATLK